MQSATLARACDAADVEDFNGEAVSFLSALLFLANGTAENAAEAVRIAYGLD